MFLTSHGYQDYVSHQAIEVIVVQSRVINAPFDVDGDPAPFSVLVATVEGVLRDLWVETWPQMCFPLQDNVEVESM